jgi:hypothetical protein
MTTSPEHIHSAGSTLYVRDHIDANDITWFREMFGPNVIASVPPSASFCQVTERVGDLVAGTRNVTPVPEAGTLGLCLVGLALMLRFRR